MQNLLCVSGCLARTTPSLASLSVALHLEVSLQGSHVAVEQWLSPFTGHKCMGVRVQKSFRGEVGENEYLLSTSHMLGAMLFDTHCLYFCTESVS